MWISYFYHIFNKLQDFMSDFCVFACIEKVVLTNKLDRSFSLVCTDTKNIECKILSDFTALGIIKDKFEVFC